MEYDVRRKDKLVLLPVQSIRPNPSQPRRSFDADEIANLSESIRKVGVLSPAVGSERIEKEDRWIFWIG